MSDKNVDFMRKTHGEEVGNSTLPTQQNKNSSGSFDLVFEVESLVFKLIQSAADFACDSVSRFYGGGADDGQA